MVAPIVADLVAARSGRLLEGLSALVPGEFGRTLGAGLAGGRNLGEKVESTLRKLLDSIPRPARK